MTVANIDSQGTNASTASEVITTRKTASRRSFAPSFEAIPMTDAFGDWQEWAQALVNAVNPSTE